MDELTATFILMSSLLRRILVLALRDTWRPITDVLLTKVITLYQHLHHIHSSSSLIYGGLVMTKTETFCCVEAWGQIN